MLQVDAFPRSKVDSVQILVLKNTESVVNVVVVLVDLLVVLAVLLKDYLLEKLLVVSSYLGDRVAERCLFELRIHGPDVDLALVDVDFQDHVCCGYELIIIVKAGLWVDVRQYLALEIIARHVGEFIVLVGDLTNLVVQEISLDVCAHLLLLVLYVRGYVLLFRGVQRMDEIDTTIVLAQEE